MTFNVRRALAVVGFAAVLASAAFVVHARAASTAQKAGAEVAAKLKPAVQLAKVDEVKAAPREEIVGALQPQRALQLGFEVAGRIAKIGVARGAHVQQGQVVAQLDAEVISAQVQQAEAALRAAEAQAAMARDTADRQRKLEQGGSISQWQSSNAEAQAKAAEAQVGVAKAALAQARAGRSRHTLRAPFAGTVIEAPDQIGGTVGPGAALFTIEDLDTLTLKLTVPESARAKLSPGARVRVEAVSGQAVSDDARVAVVLPSADASTRRIPVEIRVPNRDHRFVAHTLARATLSLGDEQVAAALPSTALASAGGDHVFVLEDGVAKKVMVTVLDRGAERVTVQGLPRNARVIDSPALDLEEGVSLEVKQ